jgi:hypothetical protein
MVHSLRPQGPPNYAPYHVGLDYEAMVSRVGPAGELYLKQMFVFKYGGAVATDIRATQSKQSRANSKQAVLQRKPADLSFICANVENKVVFECFIASCDILGAIFIGVPSTKFCG